MVFLLVAEQFLKTKNKPQDAEQYGGCIGSQGSWSSLGRWGWPLGLMQNRPGGG